MKMPIYFNELTYEIRQYGKRRGIKILLDKKIIKTSREVSIGCDIPTLNNRKFNNRLLNALSETNGKSQGCVIKITNVEPIVQCGYTNNRFEDEE
jgi:hypothetical protein